MVAEGTTAPDESVRVVVVDDQELFRRGLTMLLAAVCCFGIGRIVEGYSR